jgi:hypothetical protein
LKILKDYKRVAEPLQKMNIKNNKKVTILNGFKRLLKKKWKVVTVEKEQ